MADAGNGTKGDLIERWALGESWLRGLRRIRSIAELREHETYTAMNSDVFHNWQTPCTQLLNGAGSGFSFGTPTNDPFCACI